MSCIMIAPPITEISMNAMKQIAPHLIKVLSTDAISVSFGVGQQLVTSDRVFPACGHAFLFHHQLESGFGTEVTAERKDDEEDAGVEQCYPVDVGKHIAYLVQLLRNVQENLGAHQGNQKDKQKLLINVKFLGWFFHGIFSLNKVSEQPFLLSHNIKYLSS